MISGRILEPNSASMTASIASVLACFPIAREKSLTWRGLTTARGNLASLQPSSKGCSRPPVLSHTISVGLDFLAYFTNAWIPAGVLANSSTSPVARLNTSSRGLLMSMPMNTSVRIKNLL